MHARTATRGWLTIPNLLTSLRILLIPFFILAALRGHFSAALVIFVSAALTDALDGWIARRFNQRSRIGALLDPAADKTMLVSGFIVFTLQTTASHRLPPWLTGTVFIRDVTIVLFAYLLYTRIHIRRFPPTAAGKLSTIMQAIALGATIAANTPISWFALPILPAVHRLTLLATLYSSFDYVRRWDLAVEELKIDN